MAKLSAAINYRIGRVMKLCQLTPELTLALSPAQGRVVLSRQEALSVAVKPPPRAAAIEWIAGFRSRNPCRGVAANARGLLRRDSGAAEGQC